MNLRNRHQNKKDKAWLFEFSAYCNLLINHLDKIHRTGKKQSKFMEEFTETAIDFRNKLEIILEISYQENIHNTTIQELSNKIETITRKTI